MAFRVRFFNLKTCIYFFWVYLQTDQGVKCFTGPEADQMTGDDPDYAQRDLYNAIEKGNYPSWTMYIQVLINIFSII